MNNIEVAMLEAIKIVSRTGRAIKISDNTVVEGCDFGGGLWAVLVLLHSKTIASIYKDKVFLYNCGRLTPTTKGRLNAICLQYAIPTINQRRGVWYHDDVLPFEEGGKWSINEG